MTRFAPRVWWISWRSPEIGAVVRWEWDNTPALVVWLGIVGLRLGFDKIGFDKV